MSSLMSSFEMEGNALNIQFEDIFTRATDYREHEPVDASEHIYLKKFEVPQICLFDTLINKFPFVTAAHHIANQTIAHAFRNSRRPALIDIGIGRGFQAEKLLKTLQKNAQIEKLSIIGVEPFEDAMSHAVELLSRSPGELPFEIEFRPIISLVESLSLREIQLCIPDDCDKLMINASLTAHHIPKQTQRFDFFEMLINLNPDGLLLTEPDTDHMESHWEKRKANAQKHYGAVFNLIDNMADTSQAEMNALKAFFAREIFDVTKNCENSRFERHEACEQWLTYLRASGFSVQTPFPVDYIESTLDVITLLPGCIQLAHDGTSVLSVIYATRPNASDMHHSTQTKKAAC